MDGLERIEIQQREEARLRAVDTYHSNKRSNFIGSTVIAILGIALLALVVLFYVVVFVFSPGILVSMLILGAVGWVAACLTSFVVAALLALGLYAVVRNTRKTAILYAGCCVLATGLISAFGGLSNAEDFLRGRYNGSSIFNRTADAIPSASISNFSSPEVPNGEQHLSAHQGESRAVSSAPSAGAGTPVGAADRTNPNPGGIPVLGGQLATQEGIQATQDQPTQANPWTSRVRLAAGVPPTPVAASQGDTNVPVQQARTQRPVDDAGTSRVASTQPAAMQQTAMEKRDEPTGPSFDCTKARTFHEQHVCANANLAKLDVELAAQYKAAMTSAKVPHVIRLDQGKWWRELDICRDDACLAGQYEARIEQLKKVAAGTADR